MNFLTKKRQILKESKKQIQTDKIASKEQTKNAKVQNEIEEDQIEIQGEVRNRSSSKSKKQQQQDEHIVEVEEVVEEEQKLTKAQKKELKKKAKLQQQQQNQQEELEENEESSKPQKEETNVKQHQNGQKVPKNFIPQQADQKQQKIQDSKSKDKNEIKSETIEKVEPKIVKKPKITIIEEDDSEEEAYMNKQKASKQDNKNKKNKGSDSEAMEEDDDDSDLEELKRVKKQMQDSDNESEEGDNDDDSEEENFKDISSDDEENKKKKKKQPIKDDKKKQQDNKKDQKKGQPQNNKNKIRNLNQRIKLKHLAICIPDSIISIPQSSELRSYFISELARTAAIFCVDEIIILKDNSYIAKSQNFQQGPYIARNLQYLETPQYLRKQLFPIHPDLKNAGLMNPIECHHHLKSDQYCPYREGVIMNRPVKENDGSWVEIGLKKQAMIPYKLATNTRVTLRINEPTIEIEQRNYTAEVVSQKEPKEKLGLSWGYQVRLADNINQLFKGENDIKYDIKFLINQGDHDQLSEDSINDTQLDFNNSSGYNNLESIVDSDELSRLTGKDALTKFDANFTMQKGNYGVKQLRLEEEMAQALSIIRRQFN